MFNLPTLPPLPHVLWLHASGTYVRSIDPVNRRVTGTCSRENAMALPEPQAIAFAHVVIRSTGQTVELRPVEPGQVETTGEGHRL